MTKTGSKSKDNCCSTGPEYWSQSSFTGNKPYTRSQIFNYPVEKEMLAEYLVKEFIKPDTSIFLDAGSTIRAIAKAIFKRESSGERLSIDILTNNMMIFEDFNECVRSGYLPPEHSLTLVITGGEYDRQHEALFGSVARTTVAETIESHMSFIGTSGLTLDKEKGAFHSHGLTAEQVIKEAIFQKDVIHRIIACNHSRLGRKDTLAGGKMQQILKNAERATIVVGKPQLTDYKLSEIGRSLSMCDVQKIQDIVDGRNLSEDQLDKPLDELLNKFLSNKQGINIKEIEESFQAYEEIVTKKHNDQEEKFKSLVVGIVESDDDHPALKDETQSFPLQLRMVDKENSKCIPTEWSEVETWAHNR